MNFKPMQKSQQNKPDIKDVKFIKITILFPEHSSATEKFVLDNIDDIIYGLTQSDKQSKKFFSIEESEASNEIVKEFYSVYGNWEVHSEHDGESVSIKDLIQSCKPKAVRKKKT
jgi:hypothetical protein